MAVEPKRGCGYRNVGGLYLVGVGIPTHCDRLPLPIKPCPVCGEEPRFTRGIARIDPIRLWGNHKPGCTDQDPICQPEGYPDLSAYYLMWVGEDQYTTESFTTEAQALGVSKRIPGVPKDMLIGHSYVLLARKRLIPGGGQFRMDLASIGSDLKDPLRGYGPGVFYAFKPTAIEKVLTRSQATPEEVERLKAQGITVVTVPDDDPDHRPRKGRKGKNEADAEVEANGEEAEGGEENGN